nr:hypothetical protein Iba_chr04cCG19570 [Ipomoea batatas]
MHSKSPHSTLQFINTQQALRQHRSRPAAELVSSCSTDAIESKEASDAPQLGHQELGHQANTEAAARAEIFLMRSNLSMNASCSSDASFESSHSQA